MKKVSSLLAVALLFGGIASAETDNTTLTTPPGCYVGSGCDQNGWAVSNDGSTELGLTAILYKVGAPGDDNLGPTNPGSITGSTYNIPAGLYSAGHALWNFSWSINTDIASDIPLSNYTYLLTITDTTKGTSTFLNPVAISTADQAATCPPAGTKCDNSTNGDWGAQDSENPEFGFLSAPLHFDPNAPDDYTIYLTETNAAGALVNSDEISVDIYTPEPSTITLAGLSVIALWFVRRRQLQRN